MNREQIAARMWAEIGTVLADDVMTLFEAIVREAVEADRKEFAAESSADAERYRWLRANWTTIRSHATNITLGFTTDGEPWAQFGHDVIDAAIDRARGEKTV
jgi:hypothetical protein